VSPLLPQSEEHFSHSSIQQQSLVLWLIGFVVCLQARYKIPDSAIGCLLLFLYTFFQVLGHFSSFIAGLACRFPSSLYRLRKTLKVDNQFTKYVVCPKCEQLYHRDSCARKIGTREESVTCHYSEFPNHPHRAHPKPSSSCTSLVRQDHIVPIQNILLSQYPVLPRAFLASTLIYR